MSARIYAQTIGAGATIRLPAGRYFYIKAASSALNLTTSGNTGSPATFANIGAGTKFGPVAEGEGWRFLDVFSAAAQNIEIAISDDGNFEIASAVTVSGSVTVQDIPASAIADTADTVQATGTQTVIAANLSRRYIEIGVLSTAGDSVRVSQAGGAGRGQEIQPGTSARFDTTAALIVRNDNTLGSAGNTTWWAEEYS